MIHFKLFFALIFVFVSCESAEIQDVDFIGKNGQNYQAANAKTSKSFVDGVSEKTPNFQSFKSEFSMVIQTYVPKRETFHMDGKLFFDKDSKNVKIQLMDSFFGLIFSELIAGPNQIQLKPSGEKIPQIFPMGDLAIKDPNSKKTIVIPFPVIYQYITGAYIEEIKNPKAKFLISESRVSLDKLDGSYEYFFKENILERLELSSKQKGLKAIALVKNKTPDTHPPKEVITKVISLDTEKENVIIQIKMKKVNLTEVSPSTFRF
ncbi:hypothetical protein P3G55_04940 [Leptospira sp. 96542]|nr:hypothetical protein [Leptospira sp. 96542]